MPCAMTRLELCFEQVRYAGLKKEELSASVQKLVSYIDQVDVHMPQLTVRETLQFAKDCLIAVREPTLPAYEEAILALLLKTAGYQST